MTPYGTARLTARVLRILTTGGGPPIFGTLFVSDRCNLHCAHCAVQRPGAPLYRFTALRDEMTKFRERGVGILMFSGGEPTLWHDGGHTLVDLIEAARKLGFWGVSIATNGTFDLDLPVDMILLSLDGRQPMHDALRGQSYRRVMHNLDRVQRRNVCLYMAVSNRNVGEIRAMADIAKWHRNVLGISFNFHTPYPGLEGLSLTEEQKRAAVAEITALIDEGYPIFQLKETLRAYLTGDWPRPLRYCIASDTQREYQCARCVEVPGLCEKCGYLFATEFGLVLDGRPRALAEAALRYPRFLRA
jgi:MoaA/NifB/PqqE/SkfB family radical SAM enzyme